MVQFVRKTRVSAARAARAAWAVTLLLSVSSCAIAQTRLSSPVRILPRSSVPTPGCIELPDAANANPFNLCYGVLTPPNTSAPTLTLRDGGNSTNTNGILFENEDGTDWLKIDYSTENATFRALNNRSFDFSASPLFSAPAMTIVNGNTANPALGAGTIVPSGGGTPSLGSPLNRWPAYLTTADVSSVVLQPSGFSANTTTLMSHATPSASWTLRLPIGPGTSGQVLSTDGSGNTAWVAALSNPMTTTGDIIYSSSGSTPARRGIGSTGQVLTVSGGVPVWGSIWPAGTGVVMVTSGSPGLVSGLSADCVRVNATSTGCFPSGLQTTTTGDIIYASNSLGTWSKLAIGSSDRCLVVSGGVPAWSTSTCMLTGGTHTLSGNFTITGNLYDRSFSDPTDTLSCSGVPDGWAGFETSGRYIIRCQGGNRYRVQLTSY